ncbi:MAG: HAMP domain-containing protein [Flavobacteriales bacterium]|nr:HAMP domain-containing protein [Flavobacteriales bacterium]
MTIRSRLTAQFLALASLILGVAFIAVYMLSADHREEEFLGRMRDRGTNTAKLLLQVEEVDEPLLTKIESDNPVRVPEETIRIYDHHDHVIFSLGEGSPEPTPQDLLDRVRLESEVTMRAGPVEGIAFAFNDRYDRFVVVVQGQDIFGQSKLRNLARVLALTFLIGVLLIFLAARVFAQRALSPVKRLIGQLRRLGAADLSERVDEGNGTDELAQLAASFNELIARLQEAFQVQKNFIANASHEMRTPLTNISGQLDVLLLRERSGEEYRTSLASVVEDMHTLNRLADRLLLMAQAETRSTTASFVPVRMDEVLWAARSDVQRMDPAYRVLVDIADVEDEGDLLVKGSETLLRSLVSNLVENACKYAPDCTAHVTLTGSGPALRITVKDEGPGIPAEEREQIFQPFFRSLRTSGAKGHGIGLSLALRIAQLHGGSITVRSVVGMGSYFTVRLPKAT